MKYLLFSRTPLNPFCMCLSPMLGFRKAYATTPVLFQAYGSDGTKNVSPWNSLERLKKKIALRTRCLGGLSAGVAIQQRKHNKTLSP